MPLLQGAEAGLFRFVALFGFAEWGDPAEKLGGVSDPAATCFSSSGQQCAQQHRPRKARRCLGAAKRRCESSAVASKRDRIAPDRPANLADTPVCIPSKSINNTVFPKVLR